MNNDFAPLNPYGVDTSYESEIKKIRAHHTQFASLREMLVPGTIWLDQMARHESMKLITKEQIYQMLGITEEKLHHLYLVPYVFLRYPSAFSVVLDTNHLEEISPDDMDSLAKLDNGIFEQWLHLFQARAKFALKHSISDDMVAEIDGNYDYGAVVHLASGVIFPFDYNELIGFEFRYISMGEWYECIRDYAEDKARQYIAEHPDDSSAYIHLGFDDDGKPRYLFDVNRIDEPIVRLCSFLQHNMEHFDFCYKPLYKTNKGDRFNSNLSKEILIHPTENELFEDETVMEVMESMRLMHKLHVKTILVI